MPYKAYGVLDYWIVPQMRSSVRQAHFPPKENHVLRLIYTLS